MAGHSKWANIKHRKERSDAQKGKIFTRLAKEIISAVKVGGADPKGNSRLRLAIQKARAANMPTDNIDRNIKRGSADDQAAYESVTYELYGHGGVGIIVEGMTDNKNRTASDLRVVFNKKGGNLASPGAVSFNFEKHGVIQISEKAGSVETLFEIAVASGAEDFESAPEGYFVTTEINKLYSVKEAIEAKGVVCEAAEIECVPKHLVACSPEDCASNLALIEALEALDDVNEVYHNMDMSE